jgi:hypothetical protein
LGLRELPISAKSPFRQTPLPPDNKAAKGLRGREDSLPTNKPTIKVLAFSAFLVAEKNQR